MRTLHRAGLAAAAVLTLSACEETKYQLLPLEEAKHVEPWAVDQTQVRLMPQAPWQLPDEPIEIAGRRWVVTATEHEIPARLVRPVGQAGGLPFYALTWDQEPFDRLLVPTVPGHWQEFQQLW